MRIPGFYGRTDAPRDPELGVQDDKLGIGPYSNGLYEFVRHCQSPMTIGLQGEWGSGKTSLMKVVYHRLRQEENNDAVITFWFETWQYGAMGNSDALGMLLLRDLTDELMTQVGNDDGLFKLREQIRSAITAALPAAAGLATSMVTRSDRAGDAVTAAASAVGGRGGRADMRRCFGELVQMALSKKKREDERLVVFVDDLDRVRPDLAVRLLEVLKNFMDVKDCVFVVACDYEVVREGVRDLMRISEEQSKAKKDKIDAFFHKLFQVQFYMPVGAYSIETLLKEYLIARLRQHNEKGEFLGRFRNSNQVDKALDNFLGAGSTGGGLHDVDAGDWFSKMRATVQAAIGTNPRSFKRFLNLVDLTCCVDAAFESTTGEEKAGTAKERTTALAHWGLGSNDLDLKTMRWCSTLFPIVALQQRWPDLAEPLLSADGEGSDMWVGSPLISLSGFERRLRTLTGEWPSDLEALGLDTISDSLEDEAFRETVQQLLGCSIDEARTSGAIGDLAEFARCWFQLLDNSTKHDGLLDAGELEYIAAWSDRLGKMGTTKLRLTGIARLKQRAMALDPKAGDGFAALAINLMKWVEDHPNQSVGGASGDGGVWIWIRSGNSRKDLLKLQISGDRLAVVISATPKLEEKRKLPGLAMAAQLLLTELANAVGEPEDDDFERRMRKMKDLTVQPGRHYLLNFGMRHTAERNEILKDLLRDFLSAVLDLSISASYRESDRTKAPQAPQGEGLGIAETSLDLGGKAPVQPPTP